MERLACSGEKVPYRSLRREVFGEVCLLTARQPLVDAVRSVVHHQRRRLQLGVSLCDREGDPLVLADGPAENLALVGILRRTIDEEPAVANALRGNENTLRVHRPQHGLEAVALTPDDVGRRHAKVVCPKIP